MCACKKPAALFRWLLVAFLIFSVSGVSILSDNPILSFFFNRRGPPDRVNFEQREVVDGCVEREGSHFKCNGNAERVCEIGWTGDMCDVPICRPGCDPLHGYCHKPGECVCKLGWRGDLCNECMTLPGCIHGTCDVTWECNCKPGWDGLFCNQPKCKEGCHTTRGYCEKPEECKCRLGWDGETCGQCRVLPGCKNGFCTRPLECRCHDGWSGIFCDIPICKRGCDPEHGYCERQGVCRCKLGWTGEFCNECVPYPGCKRGTCRDPWECKCEPGWGGFLCSDRLDFCLKNPMLCLNGGNCTSLPAEDGHYSCSCLPGFSGSRCQDSAPGLKASSSTSMPLVVVTAIPIPVKESTDASLTRRSNATVSSSRLPITNAETRPTPDDKENELLRRRA